MDDKKNITYVIRFEDNLNSEIKRNILALLDDEEDDDVIDLLETLLKDGMDGNYH